MFTLLGFVADLEGSENDLFTATPVLELASEPAVSSALNWTTSSLEKVRPSEESYIRPLPSGYNINEGEVVWFMGQPLKAEIARHPELHALTAEFDQWNDGVPGFAWRVGSEAAFLEYATPWSDHVRSMLYNALSQKSAEASPRSRSLYKIYVALNTIDSAERLLTRALFYQQTGDLARVNAIRTQAGASKFFPSSSAFDKALAQKTAEL